MAEPQGRGIIDNRASMISLIRAIMLQAIGEVTARPFADRSQLNSAITAARWILSPEREAADHFTFYECCVLLEIPTDTAREQLSRAVNEIAGRDLHRLAAKPIRPACYGSHQKAA